VAKPELICGISVTDTGSFVECVITRKKNWYFG